MLGAWGRDFALGWAGRFVAFLFPDITPAANTMVLAWNALMDFVLAALPWAILRDVRLKLREKIGVTVAMSMGIM